MTSDAAVVSHHHEVVDLCPFANDGWSVRAAVDCRSGADIDIGSQLDPTKLACQHMPPVDKLVSKAMTTKHRAGMNGRAGTDDRIFVQHYVWVDGDAGADLASRQDLHAAIDRRAIANLDVVGDRRAGVDIHVVTQLCAGADRGLRANANSFRLARWAKEGDNAGEGGVDIINLDRRQRTAGDTPRDDRRGSSRVAESGRLVGVVDQRHVARGRVAEHGYAANQYRGIPDGCPVDQLGDVSQAVWHVSESFP